jgi:hypothetical protein
MVISHRGFLVILCGEDLRCQKRIGRDLLRPRIPKKSANSEPAAPLQCPESYRPARVTERSFPGRIGEKVDWADPTGCGTRSPTAEFGNGRQRPGNRMMHAWPQKTAIKPATPDDAPYRVLEPTAVPRPSKHFDAQTAPGVESGHGAIPDHRVQRGSDLQPVSRDTARRPVTRVGHPYSRVATVGRGSAAD